MEYPKLNYKQLLENVRGELYAYLTDYKLKALVLGISGGADSACCVAIARPVCDELGVKLIGRSITIETNKEDEIDRARRIGNAFCTEFNEVNLTDTYKDFVKGIYVNQGNDETDIDYKIRLGNIKARIRMVYLYNLAQKNKGMVLSTDNRTEGATDGVGFFTLHGDVGDYGMIQNLWKTEVYGLMNYLANETDNNDGRTAMIDCIDANPTDGLGITTSDTEQLGCDTYAEVDDILQRYKAGENELKTHVVIQRHIRNQFKTRNPYNIPNDVLRNGI